MKNSILLGSAMLAIGAMAANAQSVEYPASASNTLYDHSPWDDDRVLKLFSDAFDDDRNYPSKEEFKSIGLTMDLEFTRSHTRYRNIIKDSALDVVQDAGFNHDRLLWCNLPGGYGKGDGGYPHAEFDQDVFSMWNYTNIFGSWNYGFLLAPGSWVDAAHKNGTRIYGGIKFFEGWAQDATESTFNNFINTKANGGDYTYKYSRAFVNAAAFFGCDGYNYNSEGDSWRTANWRDFHKEVRQIARELDIEGFGIGQYTYQSSLSAAYAQYMYGTSSTGLIFDCMLNYASNKLAYNDVKTSLSYAESQGLPLENLYQGQLLVGISTDYWPQMNQTVSGTDRRKMNIAIWGEHDQSRFFQFRVGNSPTNIQENYQLLLEKTFSGAYRNPLKRPAISNYWGDFQVAGADQAGLQMMYSPGLASMIPERTAVKGKLPFQTYFSLGNGENYFYKGKQTLGAWYNMSQQDIVPTYRWLVTKKDDMKTYANDIDVRFTHEDAYIGGSSLKLSGATSTGNDIVLYRTELEVSGTPKVNIALKMFGAQGPVAGASHLSVIVKKKDSDKWVEVPTDALKGTTWEEQELTLSGIAQGDVIQYIGLRVNGTTDSNYKMLVGELKISDDRTEKHAGIDPESVVVQIREETPTTLSVMLNWEPVCSGYETSIDDFGMVYNDEINVDHFEILFKNGADGKVSEVARTAQWAAYVGNIPLEQEDQDAYIGVRSVSVDLKSYSPIVWVKIPRYTGDLPVATENPYGRTWMSSQGTQSDITEIVPHIYVEKVTTEGATRDLNYSASSNPSGKQARNEEGELRWYPVDEKYPQYYFAEDHKLVLTQGQRVKLFLKGYNSGSSESLQYDFVKAYIDYDGNYSFNDKDELLYEFGQQNRGTMAVVDPGLTFQFTVPADAKVGESRLRFVGSDAWTPHCGPVGGTVKGYSIDFPVEIQGTNTSRQPAPTYKDYRDTGVAEEPEEMVDDTSGLGDIFGDQTADFSSVVINGDVATFINTDCAWIYDLAGRVVQYVPDATNSVSVAGLGAGIYIVKMQNGQIIRSAKVVKK